MANNCYSGLCAKTDLSQGEHAFPRASAGRPDAISAWPIQTCILFRYCSLTPSTSIASAMKAFVNT
jgi:hypothetical protein